MRGTVVPFSLGCWLILIGGLANGQTAGKPAWKGVLSGLPEKEHAGFGGLCGIWVDHETGHILINLSDCGFYRSSDSGKTFHRLSETQPRGRTETPGCFVADPTGASHKLLTALVYGAPPGVSTDAGATWKMMDSKASHVDWCAIDWIDPDAHFVLTLKHESGGLLLMSLDGGKSFAEVGKGYATGWVFDHATAVVAEAKSKDRKHPRLQRTTDGGKSWNPCGQFSPAGLGSAQALPKWRDGILYWLVDDALIATSDQGATWKRLSTIKDGRYGPIFGKTAKHMFLLTGPGIIESTDNGASWSKPMPLPTGIKGSGGLTWLECDPQSETLYIMRMGTDLYKLERTR
jgi:hypothetical protein